MPDRSPTSRSAAAARSTSTPSSAGSRPSIWNPNDISKPHLFYEADSVAGALDGAAMSVWLDQGGLGGNLAQATGAKQPIYKTNIINGRPVVRFSSTKGFQIPVIDLSATSQVFVSMVVASSSSNDEIILEHSSNAIVGNGFSIGRAGSIGGNIQIILGGTNGPYVYNSSEQITSTPKIVTCLFDHTIGNVPAAPNGAHEALVWVNGTAYGGGDISSRKNTTDTFFASTTLNVGARNNATSLPFNGDIGGLVVGFGMPTGDDIETIESYFAQKYGIDRNISNVILAVEGTSLSCGFGAGGYVSNVPCQALLGMTNRIRHYNYATPSAKVSTMMTNDPARVDTKIRRGSLNVITLEGGENDWSDVTWPGVQTLILQWVAARKAAGWNKVGVCNYLPQNDPVFNIIRNQFMNPWFQTGVQNRWWDFLVDYAADPTMGPDDAALNTALYGDGVHPTDAGQTLLGAVYRQGLASIGIT